MVNIFIFKKMILIMINNSKMKNKKQLAIKIWLEIKYNKKLIMKMTMKV